MSYTFHEKLRMWMDENRLSVAELALSFRKHEGLEDCARQTIGKWFDKGYYPSATYIAALEQMMGVSWSYLFFDNPWPPEGDFQSLRTALLSMDPERRKVVLDFARAIRDLE